MPTVADFAQFSDIPIELRWGGGGQAARTLSRTLSAPVSGEGALLTWTIRKPGSGFVIYTVRVNDSIIVNDIVSSPDWSAVQEAMHTSVIRQGHNTVQFRVTGVPPSVNTLLFGDVILFYRKNV